MIQESKCYTCDDTAKGKYIALDKRDKGDGLMGHVFICFKCQR